MVKQTLLEPDKNKKKSLNKRYLSLIKLNIPYTYTILPSNFAHFLKQNNKEYTN